MFRFSSSAAYRMDHKIISFPGLALISSDIMSHCPFLKLMAWSQVKSSEATSSPGCLSTLQLRSKQNWEENSRRTELMLVQPSSNCFLALLYSGKIIKKKKLLPGWDWQSGPNKPSAYHLSIMKLLKSTCVPR